MMVTISTNEQTQKYIDVLLVGINMIGNFKAKESKNFVAISGRANFYNQKGQNNNFIHSKVYCLASKFENGLGSNIANNRIEIMGSIIGGLEERTAKKGFNKGSEFYTGQLVHTEFYKGTNGTVIKNDTEYAQHSQYNLSLVFPHQKVSEAKKIDSSKQTNYVKLIGSVNPYQYINNRGNEVNTFRVIVDSLEQHIKKEKGADIKNNQQKTVLKNTKQQKQYISKTMPVKGMVR